MTFQAEFVTFEAAKVTFQAARATGLSTGCTSPVIAGAVEGAAEYFQLLELGIVTFQAPMRTFEAVIVTFEAACEYPVAAKNAAY